MNSNNEEVFKKVDAIIKSNPYSSKKINIFGNKQALKNKSTMEALYDIIQKQTVLHDEKRDRYLGFDDNIIIEITYEMRKQLGIATKEFLTDYINRFQENGKKEDRVSQILAILSALQKYDACYLDDIPEFCEIKETVFEFVRRERNSGDFNREKDAELAICLFLDASKDALPKGDMSFEGISYIINIEREKEVFRADFIAEMLKSGVIDYEFLLQEGTIAELDFEEIEELFRSQNLLSNSELVEALIVSDSFENKEKILEHYYKNDKKFFFHLASTEDLMKFMVEGKFDNEKGRKSEDYQNAVRRMKAEEITKIDPELIESFFSLRNLPKNSFISINNKNEHFIDKSFITSLSREAILRLILSQKVVYKNPLNSSDIIDLYGKLTFEDMTLLNQHSLVNSEDLIKLVKFSEVKENEMTKKGLIDFYSFQKLEELLNNGKINKKFAENFNQFVNDVLNKEEKEAYMRQLSDEFSQKEDKDALYIRFMQSGIELDNVSDYEMQLETIADLFLEEKLPERDIFKLYQKGLVSVDTINQLFTSQELIENYQNGILDFSVLAFVEDRDIVINEELENGNLNYEQLMQLYAMKNGIEIDSLKDILLGIDISGVGLGKLLPDTISPQKVEKLFKEYLISQDELSELVERNIISKEEAEKYSAELASHEAYESLFSGSGVAVLTRETEEGESRIPAIRSQDGNKRPSKVKNDPYLQELLLDKIGFDDRKLALVGYRNSLDGYLVYPSEKYGVMVFINLDKPSNATYIMSLQQAMYLLKNGAKKNVVESSATKKELRETEHVKVRNASRGWGKNVVDTIKKLSPEFKAKMTKDDSYVQKLEELIDEIREDYDYRRD